MALGLFTLTGCVANQSSNTGDVSGSAAGSNASGTQVEKSSKPLGTLAFYEDQHTDWYSYLTRNYKLTSTLPVLRLLAQQTNCFVIVERGKMMDNMMQERALARSGESRSGSGFGKGKLVAADYTISPEIFFSGENVSGGVGGVAASTGGWLGVVGVLAGGFNKKETQITLILIENRSGVQLAAAVGVASHTDFLGLVEQAEAMLEVL